MTDPLLELAQYGGPVAVLVYMVYQAHFGAIKQLDRRLCVLVTVTRALARQTQGVDVEEVEKALQKNGLDPGDFLEDKAVVHHSRGTRSKRGDR